MIDIFTCASDSANGRMEVHEIIGIVVIFWLIIAIFAIYRCFKGPCSSATTSKVAQTTPNFQSQTLSIATECSSVSYTNLCDDYTIYGDQYGLSSDEKAFKNAKLMRKLLAQSSDASANEFSNSLRSNNESRTAFLSDDILSSNDKTRLDI